MVKRVIKYSRFVCLCLDVVRNMQDSLLGIYLAGFVYIIGFVVRVLFVPSLEGWLYLLMISWLYVLVCMYVLPV